MLNCRHIDQLYTIKPHVTLIRAFSDFKAFFIYFDWRPIKIYKKALKSEKARITVTLDGYSGCGIAHKSSELSLLTIISALFMWYNTHLLTHAVDRSGTTQSCRP